MPIQVKVIGPRGDEKIIDLTDSEEHMKKCTVRQLKEKIAKGLRMKSKDDFRMVFRTEPLEESSLLLSYGIRHMSTIHIVLIVLGGC